MVYNTNNTPPASVVEEIIIEEQTIEELREQIEVLQEELIEQKRHADKMEGLAWEMWEEKKGLQTKLDNLKSKLLGSLFQNKKKSREIKNLKEELQKEREIWDRWINNKEEEMKDDFSFERDNYPKKIIYYVKHDVPNELPPFLNPFNIKVEKPEIIKKLMSKKSNYQEAVKGGFKYKFRVSAVSGMIRVREEVISGSGNVFSKITNDDKARKIFATGREIIKEIYEKYRDKNNYHE